ncbi:MAG: hypothetical protein BWY82_01754 [Verrucomicrobia bacterium ADurb.Bin474]|nr:MAG: hypothetical protein BWY82_01754 [Verrucomicrobia bacterium ADurb.Bin474]
MRKPAPYSMIADPSRLPPITSRILPLQNRDIRDAFLDPIARRLALHSSRTPPRCPSDANNRLTRSRNRGGKLMNKRLEIDWKLRVIWEIDDFSIELARLQALRHRLYLKHSVPDRSG